VGRRQRDSELVYLTDEELLRLAGDRNLAARDRLRYAREAKNRKLRNVQKRKDR